MSDHSRTYSILRDYLPYLAPLLATAFLYRETLVRLGGGLMTYENSHGLVILAISVYLVWSKRHEFGRQTVKPGMIAGSVVAALGCALLVAGKYSASVILSDASLILTLMGLTWLLLGTGYLKILALPIGYLLFAYPVFDYLPAGILAHLQYITAWLAEGILKITGISVHRDSVYLELPNVTLQVAQVCAGTSHIIALLAVSVLLAHYSLEGWLKKAVLVTAALFIGLTANGLRVAVIGILSMWNRNGALHGPSDIFYVSFVFLVGLALIIGLNYLMGGRGQTPVGSGKAKGPMDEAIHGTKTGQGSDRLGNVRGAILPLSLLIATLIPVSASAYMRVYSPQPVQMKDALVNVPVRIGDWNATCAAQENFIPADIRPDERLARCYQNEAGDTLHLYVAYFTHQRQGQKLTDFTLNAYTEGDELAISMGGERNLVRRAVPNRQGPKEHIYFLYSIGGRVFSNRIDAKMSLLINGIFENRTNGSLVVMKIERARDVSRGVSGDDRAILESILPVILHHMSS